MKCVRPRWAATSRVTETNLFMTTPRCVRSAGGWLSGALALVACVLVQRPAAAQPARAGNAPDALPGVYDVPLLLPRPLGYAARVGLGYGLTEAVLSDDDSHHRAQLDVAASLTGLPWFAGSLRVLGRYDAHSGGPDDGDYGIVSETHLSGRAEFGLAEELRMGGELALWLPGAKSLSDAPGGLSGDLQLLVSYLPTGSPLALGLALGLRVDRSRHTGGNPDLYSLSDRLALGASSSALAARMGLGASYRLSTSVDLIAEWSWKMYFDYASSSPMWVRLGARYRVARAVQLEALLGVSPSKRPPLGMDDKLAVVEPRVAASLAVSLDFPWEVSEEAEVPPPPPIVITGTLRGQVVAANGQAIPGAVVSVAPDAGSASAQEHATDANGEFTIAELTPGAYRVRVAASGFIAQDELVQIAREQTRALQVTLKRELPKGQIRGTVREFNGKPVRATIVIAALDVKQEIGADGSFEVNAPPGEYEVAVKARGYKSQTRKARVEEDGVTILIVELERTSRK